MSHVLVPEIVDLLQHNEVFTHESIYKNLQVAADYFNKAKQFEFEVQVHQIQLWYAEHFGLFENVGKIYSDLSKCYESIIQYPLATRVNYQFYHVVFSGKGFRELDGKHFIYKVSQFTLLEHLKDKLLKTYANIVNGPIKPRFTFDSLSISSLPKDENLICMKSLNSSNGTPAPQTPSVLKLLYTGSRSTCYDEEPTRNVPLMPHFDTFTYESTFTRSGKSTSDVTQLFMRRYTMTTDNAFPYTLPRQPLHMDLSTSDEDASPVTLSIITPCQLATLDVNKKITMLQNDISVKEIQFSSFEPHLRGALTTRLHIFSSIHSFSPFFSL